MYSSNDQTLLGFPRSSLLNAIKAQPRQYNLFISHAWDHDHSSTYYTLTNLLNKDSAFRWRDYSVPKHDPLQPRNTNHLKQMIDEQIRQCSCVVLIGGQYIYHRKWIQFELEVAKKYNKPILGVRPWGQQYLYDIVQKYSTRIVC
jgi:hypothetical protein